MADPGNIREVEFAPPPQVDDVVAMLEDWLERARAGEFRAVGIVGVKAGGIVSTQWRGTAGGWFHHLNSAAAILQHRLMRENV